MKTQTQSKSTMNFFCDKIYVICLKDNVKNKQNISKYLKKYKIKFEFINAINGSKDKICQQKYAEYLSWDYDNPKTYELEKKYKRKLISSPNAFALSLTYKKIFTQAIQNNYSNICILEEDFIFSKNINHHLGNFLSINKSFDILYLGCSQHTQKNIVLESVKDTDTKYYLAPRYTDGSFATIYSSKIFKDIIQEINRFNAPFDSGPLRKITAQNNSYVIYPNVVVADTTAPSTISKISRNLRNHKHKVLWDLKDMDFDRDLWKVSIIMANYNNSQTIRRSIQSVLNQNYKNIELIIVDDLSTDDSVKIIQKMAKKDKRIKPIYLKNNVGAYKARNIALEQSSGFFISMLDPDDFYLSNKITIDIYNYFNYDNCELFFSNMYRTQHTRYKSLADNYVLSKIEDERKPHLIKTRNTLFIYGHDAPFDYKLRFGLPTIFADKDFFNKYGPWNETYRYGMDLELVQRYVLKKYNKFINHQELWKYIYEYKAINLGIYLSTKTNYVSFISDKKNATSICNGSERENIHNECNKKLQEEEAIRICKPKWKVLPGTEKTIRQNIKRLPKDFDWKLYSDICEDYWLVSRQDCIEHYLSVGNPKLNNSLRYDYVSSISQDMIVCLCYFSYKKNEETLISTNKTIMKLKESNVPLFSAQLLYNDQNSWIDANLTIRTKSQPLFYKENLWNIIYSKNKNKYKKMLFVDSDIVFSDTNWYEKTRLLLDQYDVIQPFEDCRWSQSGNIKKSIAYGLAENKPISLKEHHTGFAIGVNSNWFDKIGSFYDKAIVGGGDLCFWSCVAKCLKNPIPHTEIDQYCDKYDLSSYEKLIKLNLPKVGYLKGVGVMHMDHNKLAARQYASRSGLLTKGYESSMTKTKEGLYEIDHINSATKLYFNERASY